MTSSITIAAAPHNGPGWVLCWREGEDRPDAPGHTQWYLSCDDAMAVRLLMRAGATFDAAHAEVVPPRDATSAGRP